MKQSTIGIDNGRGYGP